MALGVAHNEFRCGSGGRVKIGGSLNVLLHAATAGIVPTGLSSEISHMPLLELPPLLNFILFS